MTPAPAEPPQLVDQSLADLAAQLRRHGEMALDAKAYGRLPPLIGTLGASFEMWRRGVILYLLDREPDWPWNDPQRPAAGD